jgi:hypothetical protein
LILVSSHALLITLAFSYRRLIVVVLHPYYKLAYIGLAWGGAKEQEAERKNGNPHAVNWQDEARKVLEDTVRNLSL